MLHVCRSNQKDIVLFISFGQMIRLLVSDCLYSAILFSESYLSYLYNNHQMPKSFYSCFLSFLTVGVISFFCLNFEKKGNIAVPHGNIVT